jgi:hypothetical protein
MTPRHDVLRVGYTKLFRLLAVTIRSNKRQTLGNTQRKIDTMDQLLSHTFRASIIQCIMPTLVWSNGEEPRPETPVFHFEYKLRTSKIGSSSGIHYTAKFADWWDEFQEKLARFLQNLSQCSSVHHT